MCDFVTRNKKLFDELDIFIDSLPCKEGALIQVLHTAQDIFGYLPKEVQLYISKKLNIPPSKVYGVVSFYSYFTTEPIGKYKISVCLGTVCFVTGSDKILAEFEKQLGIKNGQTTKDHKFTLEGLRCVGACGLDPVVVVNGKV
ncbi:MAG: NAD(P)H-dependent oxidoreductase subunit E, partial [Romboutsia sp.]|nr:NAD(P)H-dependent oxidoreductase subunit E [Romboutsia sp.]